MSRVVRKIMRRIAPFAFLDPEGEKGIAIRGHRGYVGGMWEELGKLQFDFLVSRGLRPDSYLLDIACGSLRLGVKAIPFLDPAHYMGIEKEEGLIRAGMEKELDPRIVEEKRPAIVVSGAFEFEKLEHNANFAIANSLFTHLPAPLIETCFAKLRPKLEDTGVFYATYFETRREVWNPASPHDHGFFAYTREQMCAFGRACGFRSAYIGDWNHPRKQVMVEYRKTDGAGPGLPVCRS